MCIYAHLIDTSSSVFKKKFVPVVFEIVVTFPLAGSQYLDESLSWITHRAFKYRTFHLTDFTQTLTYLNSSNESSIRFLTNCIWYSWNPDALSPFVIVGWTKRLRTKENKMQMVNFNANYMKRKLGCSRGIFLGVRPWVTRIRIDEYW